MIKRNLLVMGLALLLSACGFQLRGTGDSELTIKELSVSARNAYGDTVKQLTQVLERSGVNVFPGAPYKLILTDEQQSQRASASRGSGGAAEYELKTVLKYEIRGDKNLLLLSGQVEIQKYYLHDTNNLTGGDQEAVQLRKEMGRDLVQQMVMRLQLLTPEQLEQLQQTADARAKAEADALEAARELEESTPQQSPLQIPHP